ncbi:hypothetical protein [Halovivax limisalsi]|uniref:hypothetical protein n=1 Tax=Halovivax limisalsi TaxID=1453760 RepID=UPI0031B827FC
MSPVHVEGVGPSAYFGAESTGSAVASVLSADPTEIAVGAIGLVATVVVFAWVRRDASANDVPRARLWPILASGAVALGLYLYLFAPVPMTGVIMTSNTGLVLYGFERELATRDPAPTEPGTLPHAPTSSDESTASNGNPSATTGESSTSNGESSVTDGE